MNGAVIMMAMTRENLRGNLSEGGGFRWLITTTLSLGVCDNKCRDRGGNMRSEAQVHFEINGCKT